jgi:type IV secretion system protein VirB2
LDAVPASGLRSRHIAAQSGPLEVPMIATLTHSRRLQVAFRGSRRRIRPGLSLITLLILFPALALAQSPFDTGFTAMQTLFTGTVAKVASLIAIVVGGYQFAHGEPGAKKSCPTSVEVPLDTAHAVETVPEELECASNRQ